MKILLKNVTIINSKGAFHFTQQDIFIDQGIISAIGENLSEEVDLVVEEDLHASVGWFDSSVCFGEPGFEERRL